MNTADAKDWVKHMCSEAPFNWPTEQKDWVELACRFNTIVGRLWVSNIADTLLNRRWEQSSGPWCTVPGLARFGRLFPMATWFFGRMAPPSWRNPFVKIGRLPKDGQVSRSSRSPAKHKPSAVWDIGAESRQFGHPDRLGIAATGRWGQVVSLVEDYPVGLKQVEHPSTRGEKIAWLMMTTDSFRCTSRM